MYLRSTKLLKLNCGSQVGHNSRKINISNDFSCSLTRRWKDIHNLIKKTAVFNFEKLDSKELHNIVILNTKSIPRSQKYFENMFSHNSFDWEAVVHKCSSSVLLDFANFKGKHLCFSLFISATLFKKILQHCCFSVKLPKFLRTPFFTEHLG